MLIQDSNYDTRIGTCILLLMIIINEMLKSPLNND